MDERRDDRMVGARNRARKRAGRRGRVPLRARLAGVLALLALLAVPVVLEAASASGQSRLVRLGTTPRLPSGTVDLGAAPAASTISAAAVLRPRDPRGLEEFIAAASTKGSPQFGHYLSKGQFAARFGPAAATLAAVKAQLSNAGLRVTGTAPSGMLVRFSGTASKVSRAFATSLHRYRLKGGRVARATTSAPALPSAIAGSVASVVGLDELAPARPRRVRRGKPHAHLAAEKTATFMHPKGSPKACRAATAAAAEFGGLTDDQIAYAYGAFGLYGEGDTGQGVHIGIFEQEPFSTEDMRHFDTCFFGASGAAAMLTRLNTVVLEGGIPQGPGEFGEALLDVEDVSAMAPGANIDVYENPETADGEVAQIAAMVDEDRDQIVTSSYGQACEIEEEDGQPGTQQALNYLFQQGAAQGQTFLGAAGDSGSDSCEEAHRESDAQPGQAPVSAGEIASQPYVLGVGGTTITNPTQPAHEHVWNDGGEGGAGGGGISQSFAMPSWQRASTVPGIALPGGADYKAAAKVDERFGFSGSYCDGTLSGAEADTPCRLEPDVSGQSDEFAGAVTVYSEQYRGHEMTGESTPSGWVTSGGTSSATPIWAGLLALADASSTCRNNPSTAAGVGFVSPLLYAIASNPAAYAASFNDITKGDNDQYDLANGKVFAARPGFDLASGLGSPRLTDPNGAAGLAYYLCSYAAAGSGPTITGLAPSSGSTAGGEAVTVTGTGFQSGGVSQVSGIQVGAWHADPSAIEVLSPTALTVKLPPARDTLPAGAPASEDGAGAAVLIVSLIDGQSSAPAPASTFQYVDGEGAGTHPSVTGVLPYGGSETAPAPVTILGSDFTDATRVTFGGVPAASFKVLGGSQLQVTPPPYSQATSCSPLPITGVYAGEDASNDVCQVQVAVSSAGGASSGATILPPFEGAPTFEQDGALIAPLGCGCEVYPAPTEYDYAPTPTITSVSTSLGASQLASETGGTLITVHGSGFNRFTLDYADFDDPAIGEAESLFQEIAFISGNTIQITTPTLVESPSEATVAKRVVPLLIRSLAGSSATAPVEYAGVPKVKNVTNTTSRIELEGISGAPDGGGTPIAISGKGLLGQVDQVRFTATGRPASEGSTTNFTAASETLLSTQTVAQEPTLADVQACTVTGCSATSPADGLVLYPPGQALIKSIAPTSGGSAGGTPVTIHGQNLNCPLTVSFGGTPAKSLNASEAAQTCRRVSNLSVLSPTGTAGTTVPVTVTTLEGYFTGTGAASGTAEFTFTSP